MDQFHKLVDTDRMSYKLIASTMQIWINTFPQKIRDIKHYFGMIEVEFKVHNSHRIFNDKHRAREQSANTDQVPQFAAMKLPLGRSIKDWAVNEGERKHWKWLLKEAKKQFSTEFRERVNLLNSRRKALDKRGIPTYVKTEYRKNSKGLWVIKDLHLLDGEHLLDLQTFNPAKVPRSDCDVIRAWLLRAAAQDGWRQRLTYKKFIAPAVHLINEFNEPKLGTFKVVGPVKTSATMEILRETANNPPKADEDSDMTDVSDDPTEDDTDDFEDDDDDVSEYEEDSGDQPKYGMKHVSTPKAIIDLRYRGRQRDAHQQADRRAKKQAKREADAKAARLAELAREAERKAREAPFPAEYFAKLNNLCKPKPTYDLWYLEFISHAKLRKLQSTAPGGGNWQDRTGRWIKFPGIDEMEEEDFRAVYGERYPGV